VRLSPALRMLEQGGLTILSTPFRTGLFVGSGTALASAGPIGCLLAYIVMVRGQPRLRLLLVVVYLIMIALGEMTTLFPNNGGFTGAATRFLDPAFGFAIGWVRLVVLPSTRSRRD
jgi:amino acid permease